MQFLLDSGHDPAEMDVRGRPPYLLASDKAVRDVLRRCARALPLALATPNCHPSIVAAHADLVSSRNVDDIEVHQPVYVAETHLLCWLPAAPPGRYMAAHPDAWDYSAAAIPSALTEEMERHQEARAVRLYTLYSGHYIPSGPTRSTAPIKFEPVVVPIHVVGCS